METQMLLLHAKTYYSIEEIQGGDEHYFYITPKWEASEFRLYLSYGGTGWQLREYDLKHEDAMLGGSFTLKAYLHKPYHSLLDGAELEMRTKFTYWSPFPSGTRSTDWFARLLNISAEITRVTN